MEKHAYTLVKATKKFRSYFTGSKIIAYVPHIAVKDIFIQQEALGKRCRWINRIQEYDMDIQVTNLV